MKPLGFSLPCQKRQREMANELLGDSLTSKMMQFFCHKKSGGIEKQSAPCVYVKDLLSKVVQLLNENDRYIAQVFPITCMHFSLDRLTTHHNIPDSEIWIKLSGDKGGGSFKMNFQIVNVPFPNAPENTCIFSAFEASDSIQNLHIALEQFTDQVDNLQGFEWRYEHQHVILT